MLGLDDGAATLILPTVIPILMSTAAHTGPPFGQISAAVLSRMIARQRSTVKHAVASLLIRAS